ncbi:MAG: dihydrolipoamide acetyltransferase family protein [Candidatus Izemoplasmataceae bacterium]
MVDFKFADIGEGIHEGVILKWEYKVGDTIEEGETLVVIETDKVNAEIPAPTSGVIKSLGPDVGETVHVGETLAKIAEEGDEDTDDSSDKETKETKKESKEEVKEEKEEKEEPKKEAVSEDEEESAGVVGEISVSNDVIAAYEDDVEEKIEQKRVLATPVARKLAKDLGVDIKTVNGSGQQGRVMKEDIQKAANQSEEGSKQEERKESSSSYQAVNASLPKFDESRVRREKVSKLRETIARNMSLSKTVIPHTTVMDEVDVTKLVTFRNEQKALAEEKGVHLTYMPLIIKALTAAIHEYPQFNTSFDSETKELIYKDYINVGVAVDTPDGLIVPNIKDADKLSIFELAKELHTMKEKAGEKKIQLSDLNDGTISVTNYGIFDSTFGAPVIKFPEVAIIGIGRISKKPVVVDGEIVVRDILPLSLSIDHRVIDGGDAGRFLRTFKEYLTSPMLLLLS